MNLTRLAILCLDALLFILGDRSLRERERELPTYYWGAKHL